MINHNGKTYPDNALIDWNIATNEAGYYFERARYLGLSKPPACFAFDNQNPTPAQLKIIGQYHELFNQAEKCDIENIDTFDSTSNHAIN